MQDSLPETLENTAGTLERLSTLVQQAVPGCSQRFLSCVDWMLRPRPAERPQNVAELRAALEGRSPVPEPATGNWARTQIIAPSPAPSASPGPATVAATTPPALPVAPGPEDSTVLVRPLAARPSADDGNADDATRARLDVVGMGDARERRR